MIDPKRPGRYERIHAQLPLEPVGKNYHGEVARRYRYADGSGEIGLITSVTKPFCGSCTRMRLSPEGEIFTCLFASKGTDPPRAGVVPRYYLVGKALFVYWPSGFEFPWPGAVKNVLVRNADRNLAARVLHGLISLRWIPNVGQMRFIYGGKNGQDPPAEPAVARSDTN